MQYTSKNPMPVGKPVTNEENRSYRSTGHVGIVMDTNNIEYEVIEGIDGDYYSASVSNVIGINNERVGFRPAPLGLAAKAVICAGSKPTDKLKRYVEEYQSNLFSI